MRRVGAVINSLRVRASLTRQRLVPWWPSAKVLLWLISLALVERVRTILRKARRMRPRVLFGPSPILNIRDYSDSLKRLGYESQTCVIASSTVTKHEDFDHYMDEFGGPGELPDRVRQYAMFAWAMRSADVFFRFFDLGILRLTPLQWLEYPLSRLAGKGQVVMPYGGDIAVIGHLGNSEGPLLADYPDLRDTGEMTKRRVLHSLRWADVSLKVNQAGYQPSYDAMMITTLAIDPTAFGDARGGTQANGRNGEVSVVHAPNHRNIKGTAYLEDAVEALRAEGLQVRLQILEGRPNDEVRRIVQEVDIVADQFILSYALFAVEGLAAGKPVLSNLGDMSEELRRTEQMRACPIVDTNPDNLRDNLRELVQNPELRERVGRAGREFVLRYHSHDAVGPELAELIEHAWRHRHPIPEYMKPGA